MGKIRCPHVSRNTVLSFVDMQLFATPEVFTRYDEYINRKGLEALTDYNPCANAQCGSGGSVDFASDSFATCGSCETLTCVACKTRYHPGLTHAENMTALTKAAQATGSAHKRLEEETASQTFVDN
jgi:IBR domain, a half RING-finger domain